MGLAALAAHAPDLIAPALAAAAGGYQRAAPAAAGAPIRIMPLGDSITFGTPHPAYGGYRHALWTLLGNDGFSVAFVGSQRSAFGAKGAIPDPANEGHPGWTIPQLKKGIDTNRWLETAAPDVILLHIGTNDIRYGYAAAAPGQLAALLDDILGRLPRAHVIVAQIIPFRSGPDQDHQSYNDAIPGIVAAKGRRVSLVDMQRVLAPSDYADGLHPNAGGYDKLARAWEAGLRAVLARSPAR
jgi:lysophospholipase L1-like esterase